jgi:hypothetical protein
MPRPVRADDTITLNGESTLCISTLLCDSYYEAFHISSEINNTSPRVTNLILSLPLVDKIVVQKCTELFRTNAATTES